MTRVAASAEMDFTLNRTPVRIREANLSSKARDGFTLIEMLVVLVIIAVLLRLAAPSFQRLIVDSRMTTQSNELLTTLYFARSEAVKRNAVVSVCKSADGSTCATSGTWAQGWIVFTDSTASGTLGTVDSLSGDEVLRAHGALTGNSTLVGRTALASYVSYLANGQSSQTGKWNLCSPFLDLDGRDIRLNAGGRPTVVHDVPPLSCT